MYIEYIENENERELFPNIELHNSYYLPISPLIHYIQIYFINNFSIDKIKIYNKETLYNFILMYYKIITKLEYHYFYLKDHDLIKKPKITDDKQIYHYLFFDKFTQTSPSPLAPSLSSSLKKRSRKRIEQQEKILKRQKKSIS